MTEVAKTGDINLLKKLLTAKKTGSSVLVEAAKERDIRTVQALLKAGDKVNSRDTRGAFPLMMAAQYGHKDIVEHLLAKQEIDLKIDFNGYTAFSYALLAKSTEIMTTLLEKGADPVGEIIHLQIQKSKNVHPCVDALNFLKGLSPCDLLLEKIVLSLQSRRKYLSGIENLKAFWTEINLTDVAVKAVEMRASMELITKLIQDSGDPAEIITRLIQRNQFWNNLDNILPAIIDPIPKAPTSPGELQGKIDRRNKILEVISPFLFFSCRADSSMIKRTESLKFIMNLLLKAISDYRLKKQLEKATGFKLKESLEELSAFIQTLLKGLESSSSISEDDSSRLKKYLEPFIDPKHHNEDKFKFFNTIALLYKQIFYFYTTPECNLGQKFAQELMAISEPTGRSLFSRGRTVSDQEIEILNKYKLALIGLSTPRQKQDLLETGVTLIRKKIEKFRTSSRSALSPNLTTFLSSCINPLQPSMKTYNPEIDFSNESFLRPFKQNLELFLAQKITPAEREAFNHIFQFMLDMTNALLDQLEQLHQAATQSMGASAISEPTSSSDVGLAGAGSAAGAGDFSGRVPEGESWFTDLLSPPPALGVDVRTGVATVVPSAPSFSAEDTAMHSGLAGGGSAASAAYPQYSAGVVTTPTAPPHSGEAYAFRVTGTHHDTDPRISELFNDVDAMITREYPEGLGASDRKILSQILLPRSAVAHGAFDHHSDKSGLAPTDQRKIESVIILFTEIVQKYSDLDDAQKANALAPLFGPYDRETGPYGCFSG